MSDQRQTRKEHYTPRLLLKAFAKERAPGKFQACVFDKSDDKVFTTAIENIAAERDFNTADVGEYTVSWEHKLTDVEARAAPIIDRIRTEESLASITEQEKAELCVFAALQFIRGKDFRARYIDIVNATKAHLRDVVGSEDPLPPELVGDVGDAEARVASLRTLYQNLSEYAEHFAAKDLVLQRASSGNGFVLGDSPIALDNRRTFGPYGNIGLAVPGIEIYLPLSTRLCLGFWCPSHAAKLRDTAKQSEAALKAHGGTAVLRSAADRNATIARLAELRKHLDRLGPALAAFDSGVPLECEADNVTYLNSLQIRNAERYVISKSDSFDLARKMIADDIRHKTGQRISLG